MPLPPNGLIVVASGGREQVCSNDELRQRLVQATGSSDVRLLIHGGGRGGDRTIDRIAKDLGWPVEVIPADAARYGRQAGALRDQQMLQVAFSRAVELSAAGDPASVLVVATPRSNGMAPLLSAARSIKAPAGIQISIQQLG